MKNYNQQLGKQTPDLRMSTQNSGGKSQGVFDPDGNLKASNEFEPGRKMMFASLEDVTVKMKNEES